MADETENTETPAEAVEAPAGGEAAAEAPATPAEPETPLTPKERRQRRRAAAVAKRGPRRAATPEERQAERARKAARRRAYRTRLKERRAAAPAAEAQPESVSAPEKTGHRKVRQGIVVSDKADKTITVRIDTVRRHRRYQKTIRTSSTLHAHDERNDAGVGDTVRVVESRPLSRSKRWRLVEVVERAR
jgi:small subunit ribosomal protein S17